MQLRKRDNFYHSYTIETDEDGTVRACFNRVSTTRTVCHSQGPWAVRSTFKVDPVYKVNEAHLKALIGLSHGSQGDRVMLKEALVEMNTVQQQQTTMCAKIARRWKKRSR